MSETPANDNYAIIPHPTEPRLLLLVGATGWTLPQHPYTEAPDINRAIKEQLGIDVTVLGCVYDRYKDYEREDQHQVYALENHSPDWQPPVNGCWIDREELGDLILAIPEHRPVLETWFAEIESGNMPAQRLPWARLGWFDTAVDWIYEQLRPSGYSVLGPVEQVAIRMWSIVLRVHTTGGAIYFKALAPAFPYEPLLAQVLAELWPHHMPRVLAVDGERRWMLMEDAGTTLRKVMAAEGDAHRLEAMLPLFAQMQLASAAHLERLRDTGCPDRRLHRLPALFEALLPDTPVLLVGRENGISESEYEQLQRFTPQLKAMCTELASYNIPETLHHDDFHPGNILVNGNNYIFFDWGDSALTHPFCSMVILLRVAKFVYKFDLAALIRLRNVYLQAWTSYEPMDRLVEAFALSQRLGLLCRGLTWYNVVKYMEESARWEYEDAVPHWLQLFLHYNPELGGTL